MNNIPQNSELVIGIITTVGTHVKQINDCLVEQLKAYQYDSEVISVSKLMALYKKSDEMHNNEFERIEYYMNLGNDLRKQSGRNDILMHAVAAYIGDKRDRDSQGNTIPKKRFAYIINSLKNPDEVNLLRKIYGDAFYLIGATSNVANRRKFLRDYKHLDDEKIKVLLARDEDENNDYGQHTRDAFQHSDYFINVTGNLLETNNAVNRFLDLIFGNPFLTPTFSEYAMFMAYATSLRSADLSRQVGAVITKNNEVMASGTNDCPKYGGGLYWAEPSNDNKVEDIEQGRDYKCGFDRNKKEQEEIISQILTKFGLENTKDNIKSIKDCGIGDLTEYGRVVHGEMEALLTCSRNNINCRDAEMYVTTFPCHNCAKHIIAAGIKKVFYIEPYPKSKAFDFYKIEITEDEKNNAAVQFLPFIGVGPQRYVDLFSMSSVRWKKRKRKEKDGDAVQWSPENAELRTSIDLMNFLDKEKMSVKYFGDFMKKYNGEIND